MNEGFATVSSSLSSAIDLSDCLLVNSGELVLQSFSAPTTVKWNVRHNSPGTIRVSGIGAVFFFGGTSQIHSRISVDDGSSVYFAWTWTPFSVSVLGARGSISGEGSAFLNRDFQVSGVVDVRCLIVGTNAVLRVAGTIRPSRYFGMTDTAKVDFSSGGTVTISQGSLCTLDLQSSITGSGIFIVLEGGSLTVPSRATVQWRDLSMIVNGSFLLEGVVNFTSLSTTLLISTCGQLQLVGPAASLSRNADVNFFGFDTGLLNLGSIVALSSSNAGVKIGVPLMNNGRVEVQAASVLELLHSSQWRGGDLSLRKESILLFSSGSHTLDSGLSPQKLKVSGTGEIRCSAALQILSPVSFVVVITLQRGTLSVASTELVLNNLFTLSSDASLSISSTALVRVAAGGTLIFSTGTTSLVGPGKILVDPEGALLVQSSPMVWTSGAVIHNNGTSIFLDQATIDSRVSSLLVNTKLFVCRTHLSVAIVQYGVDAELQFQQALSPIYLFNTLIAYGGGSIRITKSTSVTAQSFVTFNSVNCIVDKGALFRLFSPVFFFFKTVENHLFDGNTLISGLGTFEVAGDVLLLGEGSTVRFLVSTVTISEQGVLEVPFGATLSLGGDCTLRLMRYAVLFISETGVVALQSSSSALIVSSGSFISGSFLNSLFRFFNATAPLLPNRGWNTLTSG